MSGDYPKHTYCMEREGLDKVCKWKLGADNDANCPHIRETRDRNVKIHDSIADVIGNTPLVRLNNITKAENIECEILVKCEFLNPGGSVKDRIGRRMIVDAERQGLLKKGDVIIEPTSGNTGVGLAMTAASKGYKAIITMPEKMSQEKRDVLKGLGATVVRTPTPYAWDHLYCHIGVAVALKEKIGETAHMLDQYKNTGNPMAHYEETGQEIWDQCEGKLDYVFLGTGTGGTLTGIARKLKEKNPNIKIIGVDPEGSILAQPESQHRPGPEGGQQTEGIGYDFIPRVIDRTVCDEWMQGPDQPSFIMARRLVREEGLLCGGSSGTALWAAVEYIKKHKIGKDKRVVVILPDNIRNYITKHLNADWMYERGYISEAECTKLNTSELVENKDWGQDKTVADLKLHDAVFMKADMTCGDAAKFMRESDFDQFPVRDANNKITGIVTAAELMTRLVTRKVTVNDPLSEVVSRDLRHVSSSVTLNELGRILARNRFVLVDNKHIATVSDMLKVLNEDMEGPKIVAAESTPVPATTWALTSLAGAAIGAAATFMVLKHK